MKLILSLTSIFLVLFLHIEVVADGIVSLPKVVRAAVKKTESSIVSIENFGGILDSSIKEIGGDKKKISGFAKPGEGPTTGIIISSDGYILTSSFNFLLAPRIITVTLNDGRKFNAKLLGKDLIRKICILKIDGVQGLPVPEFLKSEDVSVGQWSISVGKGFGGLRQSMSLGVVSGKNRIFGRAIQTDSNISPANYGGPLIDVHGKIIGICTPLSPMQSDPMAGVEWYDSGIGFVISIADNLAIIERLKKSETIEYGAFGIHSFSSKDKPNIVLVDLVIPDSPAEKSGVLSGDQILEIENQEVDSIQKLMSILNRFESGSDIKVTLFRSDKKISLSVKLVPKSEFLEINEARE